MKPSHITHNIYLKTGTKLSPHNFRRAHELNHMSSSRNISKVSFKKFSFLEFVSAAFSGSEHKIVGNADA